MNPKIRAFVDTYTKKPIPPISIEEFIKSHNHEIWRTCEHCSHIFDARKSGLDCPKCGTPTNKK